MASTIAFYTGDGTTTDFTVPFDYLAKKFVRVSLGVTILKGGDYGDTSKDYYFLDKTKVRLKVPPASGEVLTIRRYTSATDRVVSFKDASVLKATDLDVSSVQTIHIAEEARDIINDALIKDKGGNWDAKGNRIVNVGTPEADYDAVAYGVYKADALGAYQSKLDAERARDRAVEAETNSKKSEENAKLSEENAHASADTAVSASEHADAVMVENQAILQEAKEIRDENKVLDANTKDNANVAQVKANEAKVSEANAKKSEVNSKESEVNAKASEGKASTSAELAKQWATKLGAPVDGSEYSAKHYANKANEVLTQVATDVVNSVTAEGTKQVDLAKDQVTIATQSASTATAKATIATTKASEAEDSATNAANSAVTATTQATAASNSAKAAKLSEDNAALSKTAAGTSATNAKASEVEAKRQADLAKGYAEDAASGQLNADWAITDSKSKAFIKNKPTLGTLASKNSIAYSDITGTPPEQDLSGLATKTELTEGLAGKAPSAHTHTVSQITDMPNVVLSVNDITPDDSGNVKVGALPLGHLFAWPFQTPPDGAIQCNGATYNRALYNDFFTYATSKGWVKTETEWQSIASANGGYCPYYSQGDGSTTFRTPKFAPFMQVNIASANVGEYHKAGLPNITGRVYDKSGSSSPAWTVNPEQTEATGAFRIGSEGGYTSSGTSQDASYAMDFNFDASRSNEIYGRSSTVQPESHEWMICVVVAGQATNLGSVDVSNVMSAVAQVQADVMSAVAQVQADVMSAVAQVQADVSAIPTPKAYVTETHVSGTQGYRVWSDGFIEQWGKVTIRGENNNTTLTFQKPFKNTNYNIQTASWLITDKHACVVSKTTTSVKLRSWNNDNDWYAFGY